MMRLKDLRDALYEYAPEGRGAAFDTVVTAFERGVRDRALDDAIEEMQYVLDRNLPNVALAWAMDKVNDLRYQGDL